MSLYKRAIKKIINLLGYNIVPRDPEMEHIALISNQWLKNINIHHIIDIGASTGVFASHARENFPDAFIYSFEPIPSSFSLLQERFKNDHKHKAINLALNNAMGNAAFSVSDNIGSSSLLEMDELHKKNFPHSARNKATTVQTDTLDNYFSTHPLTKPEAPIMLKLDVQGAEKLILEGGQNFLKKVKIIYTEISFYELYKKQVLANELINFLEARHFNLVGFENVSRSPIDGRFLQADAYFINQLLRN